MEIEIHRDNDGAGEERPAAGNSAIAQLRDEHQQIRIVLAAIAEAVRTLQAGGSVSRDLLEAVWDYMRHFVDGYHHRREEEALFPALEKLAAFKSGSLMEALRSEHDQGREALGRLEAAMRVSEGGPNGEHEVNSITEALRSIGDLYARHLTKEELMLFPATDRAMDEGVQAELTAAFQAFEAQYGVGRAAHYAAVAASLANSP